MVGAARLELATPRPQNGCATTAPRPDRKIKFSAVLTSSALLDRKVTEVESVLSDLNSFRDELSGLRDSAVANLDQVPDGESVCNIIEQGIHHDGELALAWIEGLNLTGSR